MNKIYIYTGVLLICGLIGLLVYFLIKPQSKPIVSPKCKKGASMIGGKVKGCFCGIADGDTTSFENATDNCRHNKKQCSQLDDSECDGGKCWQVSQSICDNTKPPYFPPISKCESTGKANSLYPGLDACFCSKPINSNLSKSPGLAITPDGKCYPCLSGQNEECEYQAGPGSQCLNETCTTAPACVYNKESSPAPGASMPWDKVAGCFCGGSTKPRTAYQDAVHNCKTNTKQCPQQSNAECGDGETCWVIKQSACNDKPLIPYPQPQVCKVQFTVCKKCKGPGGGDGTARWPTKGMEKAQTINCLCQSSQKCCNGDCSKLCQPVDYPAGGGNSGEDGVLDPYGGGNPGGDQIGPESNAGFYNGGGDYRLRTGPVDWRQNNAGTSAMSRGTGYNGVCAPESHPALLNNGSEVTRSACAMTRSGNNPSTKLENGSLEPIGDCAILCASLQCTKKRNGGTYNKQSLYEGTNKPPYGAANRMAPTREHGEIVSPYQRVCTQNCGPPGMEPGSCSDGAGTPRGAFAYCVKDKDGNGGWNDDGTSYYEPGIAGFCEATIGPYCDDKSSSTGKELCEFDYAAEGGRGWNGRGVTGALIPELPKPGDNTRPPSDINFLPWITDDACCIEACQGSRLPEAPSECEYKEHGPEGNPCVWGAPPSPQ